LEGRMRGSLFASGSLTASGVLRRPQEMRVNGEVSALSAEIEQVKLTNDGPILFAIENRTLDLRQFHVKGDGTDLTASGHIGLTGERLLDLRAEGRANLQLFQGFNRDLTTFGAVALSMRVGGTLAQPQPTGQVRVENAGISFIDLPNGLSEINGTMAFNENRLQVERLTARTGGGTVNMGGYIAYSNGLYFDLTAEGKDIRLRYPEGVSSVADADVRFAGTTRGAVLSGNILVTRFGINPRFDFALYLARAKQGSMMEESPVLDNVRLDVRVRSTPELRVETSLAKISGDLDLRLRGTASRPAVLGRVNIQEGVIFFNGTKYDLERGDITFTNPVRIEPVLNMEASARVREYDISLGFHGSVEKLNATYRSDPPLPTADIIALLALGRTREDTTFTSQRTQGVSEDLSNALLGQALDAALSSRVQKIFGVSRIKIDPQVGGPENNPNARLTIEQSVNNNITLTYITNLSQSAQQIIQAEFHLRKDVSLVVVRDQNGVLGFDVRIRQRKK
ncbi:MAG: translocation/assembly module TamB domain-containing protein, partial [Terriglobales bacterium]